jgi:nicotinamidase-related amidase
MSTKFDPTKAALLLLDFQIIHLEKLPNWQILASKVANAATTARNLGITVIHCRIAFTAEEMEELPPVFARLKNNPAYLGKMLVDAPESQFHPAIPQNDGDIVIRKRRVGPFRHGPQDFEAILKEKEIDTLIVGGIATGGTVVSTILEAVDMDFKVLLLEDGCADLDDATHEFLLKFLQKRAVSVKCEDIESLV